MHVVSGSLDTSIRVWEVETGACRHTLMGHQSLTSGMELRNNILVSGNADSTVKVWDIVSGHCLQTLSGPNKHQSAVTCLQFNSHFVITSSDDGTVKLWDVKTGLYIFLISHRRFIFLLFFSFFFCVAFPKSELYCVCPSAIVKSYLCSLCLQVILLGT